MGICLTPIIPEVSGPWWQLDFKNPDSCHSWPFISDMFRLVSCDGSKTEVCVSGIFHFSFCLIVSISSNSLTSLQFVRSWNGKKIGREAPGKSDINSATGSQRPLYRGGRSQMRNNIVLVGILFLRYLTNIIIPYLHHSTRL